MLPDLTLHVSTFDHARDVVPRSLRVPLPALVRALTTFRVCPVDDKRALPAWSPARFAHGPTRRADSVRDLSCVVLDLDDADVEVVAAAWEDALHVLHTTWSHTPERPRWRLVVPLASPVPAEGWATAWAWAAARTPGHDPTCKDPARLYFVPAVARPGQPCEARVHPAPLLELSGRLDAPQAPPRPARRAVRVPARLADRVTRRRLAEDPGTRERVAVAAGARLVGEGARRRAEDAPCPACGRPSAWFWVAPDRQHRARCQHRRSCGWTGPVAALLGGRP